MNKNIFLIEDEKLILEMYSHAFGKKGYVVDTAVDGEDAYNKLHETSKNYDLILLDIMMPKLDGISLLRKIKSENSKVKDIPVILLTNLGQESLLSEALELGASKYLIKSNILPMEVVEEIDKFLQENSS